LFPERRLISSLESRPQWRLQPAVRLAALKDHRVRFVSDQPTCNLTDTLIGAIDENTSVVAVSSVQYATGTVVDISRLRQSIAQVGARLIVDATQAAGAMRVDAAAWDADAVVASGYKWLWWTWRRCTGDHVATFASTNTAVTGLDGRIGSLWI
jgi:kynureninase